MEVIKHLGQGKGGGRPMKFQSVEELQVEIDAYFTQCDKQEKPYTVSGLALALDTNRATLVNYEKEVGYEMFFYTIKKAKQKCEAYAESVLFGGKQVAGVIFSLKNNYGWKDKQEIDHTTGGQPMYLPSEILQKHEVNARTERDSEGQA